MGVVSMAPAVPLAAGAGAGAAGRPMASRRRAGSVRAAGAGRRPVQMMAAGEGGTFQKLKKLVDRQKGGDPTVPGGPKMVTLPFEKPLVELEKRIREVQKVAEDNGVDVTEQIKELQDRASQLRTETYSRLTPMQRLSIARHPQRPTFLDIVYTISDKFLELHGDRGGEDDLALVGGVARIGGHNVVLMGHQKGRNTQENISRNFGMPTPNGYRKALRLMEHAHRFKLPILTFVDTPGAYAGLSAEELGQGEAIAVNLRDTFGFEVPIISTVIGEGGSGGALAIGICDRMLMMEHSVYYVASPEACASILWKDAGSSNLAAEALKITSPHLVSMGIADDVVPEPLGGAHADPRKACDLLKDKLVQHLDELAKLSTDDLLQKRYDKFRGMGQFIDGEASMSVVEDRKRALQAI